ncbi:MAG TPA: hypothetical protein VLD60_00900 [Nitrospira sp.]|nr:hypothetical protein [Nitrospira sp.]
MQRRYEFIDLIVALGLFATIVAGGLLFMAANGTLSLSLSRQSEREQPIGPSNGTQWLQPVLGQAILDQNLLDLHYEKVTPGAVTQLNEVTGEHVRWQNSPFGYLDSIKMFAARGEADHATRVQAFMGRAIVQFTRRGVLSGVLPPGENDSPYNTRMIGGTEIAGRRMHAQFLANWQPNLGHAIVSASQDGTIAIARMQEQLGAAIVQATTFRATYEGLRSANQEQLGSATMVALRTGSFARQSYRGELRQPAAVAVTAPHTLPEIPTTTLVVASLMLMGLFMAGLLVAPTLPRVTVGGF